MMISICIATYDDVVGLWWTTQTIRLTFDKKFQYEFIIVDNNPSGNQSQLVSSFVQSWLRPSKDIKNALYIPYGQLRGTAPARQHAIEHSSGDVTVVLDSHVLLSSVNWKELVEYLSNNPKDIVSGALLHDDLSGISDHFTPQWRNQMYGYWSTFYSKKDEEHSVLYETRYDHASKTHKIYKYEGKMNYSLVSEADTTDINDYLQKTGYLRHFDVARSAYEIPGMGLGLFAFVKQNWPGFNSSFKGFGGEELYIHEKFRMNGGKAVILPKLKWVHQFVRPHGVPYPLDINERIRNYVIGFKEVGWPKEQIVNHFCKGQNDDNSKYPYQLFSAQIVDEMWANPNAGVGGGCSSCGSGVENQGGKMFKVKTLHDWFSILASQNKNIGMLRTVFGEFADSKQDLWTMPVYVEGKDVLGIAVSCASAGFDVLLSKNNERVSQALKAFVSSVATSSKTRNLSPFTFELIDNFGGEFIYMIDSTGLLSSVNKKKAKILVLLAAEEQNYRDKLHEFLKKNQEYTVLYDSGGVVILSGRDVDKKAPPGIGALAVNFVFAMARAASSGFETVGEEEFNKRVKECSVCSSRFNSVCGECGCPIERKASLKTEKCPLGKW